MASPTDVMLSELEAELEERKHFQEALVSAAQEQKRDLRPEELELIEQASKRMTAIETRCGPLREGARIAAESSKRTAELRDMYAAARDPKSVAVVEYRSAGGYIADLYLAKMGDEDAFRRIDLYNRVAAHQTMADNPGLLPEQIVAPVVNFVDESRPLVAAIGPTDLGTGTWAYARVTQHTQVGPQPAEKTELPSRKMTITKTPISAPTLGGYVNVSRQDIQRTSPGILDMIIADLAGQYAIETELATGTLLVADAVAGPTYPADATAEQIAQAVYGAAGAVFTATKGQGRTIIAASPDMLGIVGPLFPNINPTNSFGTGFSAANVGTGPNGTISGLGSVISAGLVAGTILVFSTAAVKAFEYRYGNMQVVEPSVWGVQVGYAGDFEALVIEPTAVVSVDQAP
jgi:HK97 family phage major capsid protein